MTTSENLKPTSRIGKFFEGHFIWTGKATTVRRMQERLESLQEQGYNRQDGFRIDPIAGSDADFKVSDKYNRVAAVQEGYNSSLVTYSNGNHTILHYKLLNEGYPNTNPLLIRENIGGRVTEPIPWENISRKKRIKYMKAFDIADGPVRIYIKRRILNNQNPS